LNRLSEIVRWLGTSCSKWACYFHARLYCEFKAIRIRGVWREAELTDSNIDHIKLALIILYLPSLFSYADYCATVS